MVIKKNSFKLKESTLSPVYVKHRLFRLDMLVLFSGLPIACLSLP